mmetsp:Transcript_16240/g.26488  ORF Transcript_16240/g.26488 Transcript_16240/m.26488 type:complete len:249 (-) Transcript_16240:281-1027(-)
MNLCKFIGKHIPIVVVSSHSKVSISPSNQLHGCSVRDQVTKLVSSVLKQSSLNVTLTVVLVEHVLHARPKAFLPLEHSLFGNHVWCHACLETTREKVMSQVNNIIKRVVICYNSTCIVPQVALVNQLSLAGILGRGTLWKKKCLQLSLSYSSITSSVFSTNSMSFKENWVFVTQLHTFNHDCITTDSDSVPSTSHGAIWTSPRLVQTKLLLLNLSWGNRWLLEDSLDTSTSVNRVPQTLVLGTISRNT